MQDVQVEGAKPNILVDLDRTLAYHGDNFDVSHVGEPIMPIVEKMKEHIAQGLEVRIFTARWSDVLRRPQTKSVIDKWCMKVFGHTLPITNSKDYGTLIIYDDRAKQVEQNTGRIIEDGK